MNQPWMYICSPSRTALPPPHHIPQGHPSAPALSTLSHALNLDWQSISHMIIYMFQCYSLKSSHPCLLSQSPKVCSLHLFLFHLANIVNCFVSYTLLGAGDIAVRKMLAIVYVNFISVKCFFFNVSHVDLTFGCMCVCLCVWESFNRLNV